MIDASQDIALPDLLALDYGGQTEWLNARALSSGYRSRRLQKRVVPVWLGILRAFNEAGIPQTVRQVFYKCTTYGVVPKSENGYGRVVNQLLTMRRADVIPYSWIADFTRWQRKPTTYHSLQNMLAITRDAYRRALWNDQDAYIEIWLEKDALTGVLVDITERWDIALMVARGFSSETFAESAADNIREKVSRGKRVYIYHFGDYDPSGVAARDDIAVKLAMYEDNFTFEPVAVHPWQIVEWNLPTRETKGTDSRAKEWIASGRPSCELDAIPANVLRELCENVITKHIQKDVLERTLAIEEEERKTLEHVLSGLNGASPK